MTLRSSRLGLALLGGVSLLSIAVLALTGSWGLIALLKPRPGVIKELRPAWCCLFAGSVLVGIGSTYYHIAPTDASLAWDRAPMTVAFTALSTIVLGEQVSARWASRLLPAVLLLGLGAVAYWHVTGDLRPYILVQYLPMLLIPLALVLFRPPLHPRGWLWAALLAYGVAKTFEVLDRPVCRLLGVVGGHPFKHVVAGSAVALLAVAASHRRPARPPDSGA